MANRHRGEVEAELGGRRYTLRLTLGALAELERAFDAGDLVALARRFETGRLSARDLVVVIAHGLRGGGHPMTEEEVASLATPDGLPGYLRIVSELLAATFGADGAEAARENPPSPRRA